MLGIHDLGTFVISAILLNITPGQDSLYIIGRSISQGKKAGVLSVLGICTGCLIHIMAAAFGLSAILMASSSVFMAIKIAGATYLVFMGLKMIIQKKRTKGINAGLTRTKTKTFTIYKQGFLTNLLNPKVALFFLAFIPQFIHTGAANSPWPFIFLGLVFMTTGTIWCMALALFAARLSRPINGNEKYKKWLGKISGSVFILLGVKLALEKAS
jgi:threonine/homoserine/homoserine lactone efflux protein